MKGITAFLLSIALASAVFAQDLTTEQIVARLDANAKVFKDLDVSIQKTTVELGFSDTPESGKLYLKMAKAGPRIRMDITKPVAATSNAVIDGGMATLYHKNTNSYQQRKVNPNSDALQLLLIGFGVPSTTFSKLYRPATRGRETVDGKQTAVLELTPVTTKQTGEYQKITKITLWLDPQTWSPVQTRITQATEATTTFKYFDMKLNKGVSDSVFKLDLKDAKKQ